MKIEKRWIVSFSIIAIVAITSLFWHHQSANSILLFNTLDTLNFADIAWLLTASCLVLLMTPGLSFFYGGMVGKKNVISTMLKSFICLGVISLLWVTVGFSLSFGNPIGIAINGNYYGIFGNPLDFTFFNQVDVLPHKQLGHYSFYTLCIISNEICSYYTGYYYWCISGTNPIHFVFIIHLFVYNFHLCTTLSYDLASKWFTG
jgi:hypothetical protein